MYVCVYMCTMYIIVVVETRQTQQNLGGGVAGSQDLTKGVGVAIIV